MALPATDSFTNSNGTALQSHNSNWTINVGAFDIQSNGCHPNSSATEEMAHWSGDSFDADQYSDATWVDGAAFTYVGVAARVAASAHTGYEFVSDSNDASYFGKFVSGSYTEFSSGAVFDASDVVRIEADGTTIAAYLNDVEWDSTTDSAISNGSAGGRKSASVGA